MTQYKACIYTEETGEFVNLQDYLVELGMTGLDDWDLMRGLTISDDGTVMAGMGNGPDGFGGWIIRVIEESPEEIEVSVDHLAGWNIVGIPVDTEPINYLSVYPDAVDGTFYGFDGAYFPAENLVNGDGFWLRFDEEGTNMVSGLPLESIVILITEGWNLISGISFPVDVNAIADDDGLIVSGTIYGFDSGYISAEFIEPGYGYWLRSFGEGRITLSASAPMAKVRTFQTLEQSNTLKINGQTLFFGNEISTENSLSYTLPPKPPAGAFDARFNGDMKYTVESGEISVINTNKDLTLNYTVNIHPGDYMEWVLITENGEEYILTGTDEIVFNQGTTVMTLTKRAIIPQEYTLHQNYPNPFNPITSLSYNLPEQAQVTLTVYDLMGRKVTQLVNTIQEAGYKSVQWNATDTFGKPVSAGVYLYQIQAGEFIQTRKMVLLK